MRWLAWAILAHALAVLLGAATSARADPWWRESAPGSTAESATVFLVAHYRVQVQAYGTEGECARARDAERGIPGMFGGRLPRGVKLTCEVRT